MNPPTSLPAIMTESLPFFSAWRGTSCLEGSQLLLILLLVGVREARVKMSQCTNVASPTWWMQGLGSEHEQAECAYIFRDNQIVLSLVWVQELLWCLSAAQLALSRSLLCRSLSSLLWGELGVLLESDITVEHSSRYNFNTDHYSRQNVEYTGMFSTCPVECARGPRKADRHK